MRKFCSIIMLLLTIFTNQLSLGAPVNGMRTIVKQPSGKEITIYVSGDEYYHWLHDIDGYTIVKNTQSGYYCYATLDANGDIIPTNYVVGSVDVKTTNLKPGINISSAKRLALRNSEVEYERAKPFTPKKGNDNVMNNIVIYIRFKGEEEFPAEQETYTEMFNSSEDGVSSMYNYFKEVSYGKLKIKSHFFPSNNGVTIRSYQDSHTRDYYLNYDEGQKDIIEYTLIKNAINSVKNQIPSSLNIDADGDGNVDNICFIIRGSTNNDLWRKILWPHKTTLHRYITANNQYVYDTYINGKKVVNYNIQIEQFILNVKVGVLCHEMFHTLGAPDLYHYDKYDASTPVGHWDIMANEKPIPQHMSAYMKYKYGKWIDEIPEITQSGTYTINPLTSPTNNCYMIKLKDSEEYIVIEYREKDNNGIFEKSIPCSGVLVYRINPNHIGNSKGVGPGGQLDEVYVFRTGGSIDSEGDGASSAGLITDKTGKWSTFHNDSYIKCFKSDGTPGNVYIKNVSKGNGTYSFDVRFCDYETKIYTNNDPLTELVNASKRITTQGAVIVSSTNNVTFEAKEKVRLNAGFKVENGATFHININGCGEK